MWCSGAGLQLEGIVNHNLGTIGRSLEDPTADRTTDAGLDAFFGNSRRRHRRLDYFATGAHREAHNDVSVQLRILGKAKRIAVSYLFYVAFHNIANLLPVHVVSAFASRRSLCRVAWHAR